MPSALRNIAALEFGVPHNLPKERQGAYFGNQESGKMENAESIRYRWVSRQH
jgi:hypothetical protein